MIMRLIDADRALEIVRDQSIAHPNAYHLTNYATLILREAPTVDAAEVVHGYWYEHYGIAICSHCQSMFDHDLKMLQVPSTYKMPNYCPNCGAKMDGGDDNSAMA